MNGVGSVEVITIMGTITNGVIGVKGVFNSENHLIGLNASSRPRMRHLSSGPRWLPRESILMAVHVDQPRKNASFAHINEKQNSRKKKMKPTRKKIGESDQLKRVRLL